MDDGVFDPTLDTWRQQTRDNAGVSPGWEVLERLGVLSEAIGWFGHVSSRGDDPRLDATKMQGRTLLGDRVRQGLLQTEDLGRRRAALEAVDAWADFTDLLGHIAERVQVLAGADRPWSLWAHAAGFAPLSRNGLVDPVALRTLLVAALTKLTDRIRVSPTRPLLIVGTPGAAPRSTRYDSGPTHTPSIGTLIVLGAADVLRVDRAIHDVDIWPTVLAWFGKPPAADLPGMSVLTAALVEPEPETVFTHEVGGSQEILRGIATDDHPEARSIAWLGLQGYEVVKDAASVEATEKAIKSRRAYHEACSLLSSGLAERAIEAVRGIEPSSQLLVHDELLAIAAIECDDRETLKVALKRIDKRGVKTELTELAEVYLESSGVSDRLRRLHDRIYSGERKTTLSADYLSELIARTAERSGSTSLAEEIYDRLAVSAGLSAGWSGLARLALKRHDPDLASSLALKAMRSAQGSSDRLEALAAAANASQQSGKPRDAIGHLRALIAIRPDHVSATSMLVELLRAVGEHEEAVQLELGQPRIQ